MVCLQAKQLSGTLKRKSNSVSAIDEGGPSPPQLLPVGDQALNSPLESGKTLAFRSLVFGSNYLFKKQNKMQPHISKFAKHRRKLYCKNLQLYLITAPNPLILLPIKFWCSCCSHIVLFLGVDSIPWSLQSGRETSSPSSCC